MLEADPAARARLQTAAEAIVRSLLPSAQVRIAEFIGQVVANWDTATITDRLELRVGRDLQYIRMNGTIVGFLIGGLLYAVLDTLFGHTVSRPWMTEWRMLRLSVLDQSTIVTGRSPDASIRESIAARAALRGVGL